MPAKVTFKDDLPWPVLCDPAVYFPKSQPLSAHLQFVSCRAPSGATTGPWCFADDELRMVRRVYEEVWERYLEVLHSRHPNNRKGLLIIGHPGIGKTCLLDLLLSWHLFTNPQIPVIAIALEDIHVFIRVNGKTPKRFVINPSKIEPDEFVDQLKLWGMKPGDPLVVLHDIKGILLPYKGGLLSKLAKTFVVTCVVASSPQYDNWKEFGKEFAHSKFYLPVLSETEARDFVAKTHPAPVPSDATVSQWFYLVGGVPRHLADQATVDDAVKRQKLSAPKVEYDPVASGTDNETNAIVCMVPVDEYHGTRFDFVSNNAFHLWMQYSKETKPGRLLRVLRTAEDGQPIRDALGGFFRGVGDFACAERFLPQPPSPSSSGAPWCVGALGPPSEPHYFVLSR